MLANSDIVRTFQQENSRMKEENQDLRDELFRLQEAMRALNDMHHSLDLITPETDIQSLLRRILQSALDAVDSEDGSLQLLDEESHELVFVQVQGAGREALMGYRLPPGQGIAGWVAAQNIPRLVQDVHLDPRFSPQVDQSIGFRTLSLICVPLQDGERVIGVIEVVNTRSGVPFRDSDLDILLIIARLATLALLRAEGRPGNQ